jgi:hypothetical protein
VIALDGVHAADGANAELRFHPGRAPVTADLATIAMRNAKASMYTRMSASRRVTSTAASDSRGTAPARR